MAGGGRGKGYWEKDLGFLRVQLIMDIVKFKSSKHGVGDLIGVDPANSNAPPLSSHIVGCSETDAGVVATAKTVSYDSLVIYSAIHAAWA